MFFLFLFINFMKLLASRMPICVLMLSIGTLVFCTFIYVIYGS